jgi:1-acyl-sn-glycerol-3-phosphate acyltransferase
VSAASASTGRAAAELPRPLRESLLGLAQRLQGRQVEDELGFDEALAESAYPLFELLYERWWRVEAVGVHNVPSHGRAMLVANHAGALFPFDATMITVAMMRLHPLPRWPRFMVIDWAFGLPFVAPFVRKLGGLPTGSANAERVLGRDELLIVFPEGAKGTGKPFRERYRLQRFGRGGFVEVALRTRSEIVPVAVVGSEEIYPMLGDARALARAIGAPFVPLTPTFPWLGPLGLVPLPSRWRIEFGAPIRLDEHPPEAADDRRTVLAITEQVQEAISAQLHEGLVRRGPAFG